jgi:low affinity Fe/Cu permease
MKKLTANVARKIKENSTNRVYTTLQSIIDEIVRSSQSRGTNTFIDLKKQNLEPFAEELRERGFKVWVKEEGYLEVEW